jgi:hypothetical protein
MGQAIDDKVPAALDFDCLDLANDAIRGKSGLARGPAGGHVRMEQERVHDVRPIAPNDPGQSADHPQIPSSAPMTARHLEPVVAQHRRDGTELTE